MFSRCISKFLGEIFGGSFIVNRLLILVQGEVDFCGDMPDTVKSLKIENDELKNQVIGLKADLQRFQESI